MLNLQCKDYDQACLDMVRVAYLTTVNFQYSEAQTLCLNVAKYAASNRRLSSQKAYNLWFQALTASSYIEELSGDLHHVSNNIKALRPRV